MLGLVWYSTEIDDGEVTPSHPEERAACQDQPDLARSILLRVQRIDFPVKTVIQLDAPHLFQADTHMLSDQLHYLAGVKES